MTRWTLERLRNPRDVHHAYTVARIVVFRSGAVYASVAPRELRTPTATTTDSGQDDVCATAPARGRPPDARVIPPSTRWRRAHESPALGNTHQSPYQRTPPAAHLQPRVPRISTTVPHESAQHRHAPPPHHPAHAVKINTASRSPTTAPAAPHPDDVTHPKPSYPAHLLIPADLTSPLRPRTSQHPSPLPAPALPYPPTHDTLNI